MSFEWEDLKWAIKLQGMLCKVLALPPPSFLLLPPRDKVQPLPMPLLLLLAVLALGLALELK